MIQLRDKPSIYGMTSGSLYKLGSQIGRPHFYSLKNRVSKCWTYNTLCITNTRGRPFSEQGVQRMANVLMARTMTSGVHLLIKEGWFQIPMTIRERHPVLPTSPPHLRKSYELHHFDLFLFIIRGTLVQPMINSWHLKKKVYWFL